jgi:hypothetical protein
MTYESLSSTPLFSQNGWIVGSSPHALRAIVRGAQTDDCPSGTFLNKEGSTLTHVQITQPGGVSCRAEAESHPVWCCKNR